SPAELTGPAAEEVWGDSATRFPTTRAVTGSPGRAALARSQPRRERAEPHGPRPSRRLLPQRGHPAAAADGVLRFVIAPADQPDLLQRLHRSRVVVAVEELPCLSVSRESSCGGTASSPSAGPGRPAADQDHASATHNKGARRMGLIDAHVHVWTPDTAH